MCDEDPDDIYILEVICGSFEHQVSIALSTVTLLPYLVFVGVQRILFTSRNFESEVPWGSLDPNIEVLKIALKIVVSATFTFDKVGKSTGFIQLLCSAILILVLYNRFTRAAIYTKESILYSITIQEAILMWLFISIGFQNLTQDTVSFSSLGFILFIGVCFGGVSIVVLKYQKKRL